MKQYIITTRSWFYGWLRTYNLYVKLEMFFPVRITLSLYLDWISSAILSVLHSPSAIFRGQFLSSLSGITKGQYRFVALSYRGHFWESLEACLKSWHCLNGQKRSWEYWVWDVGKSCLWMLCLHMVDFCSLLLCFSFLSFFVFILSVSPWWALALGFANLSATSMHRLVLSKENDRGLLWRIDVI